MRVRRSVGRGGSDDRGRDPLSRIGRRQRDAELTSADKVLISRLLRDYQALLQPDGDLSVLLAPGEALVALEWAIHVMSIC